MCFPGHKTQGKQWPETRHRLAYSGTSFNTKWLDQQDYITVASDVTEICFKRSNGKEKLDFGLYVLRDHIMMVYRERVGRMGSDNNNNT